MSRLFRRATGGGREHLCRIVGQFASIDHLVVGEFQPTDADIEVDGAL
ncbi:MAG: hypothetical protein ACI9R3_002553 [Verrucomicrobiales bacterium]|jgi:hypothetical protein